MFKMIDFGIEKDLYKYPSLVEVFNESNIYSESGFCLEKNQFSEKIKCIIPSPWHGRSVSIFKSNDKWMIIKGAGCPYLDSPYKKTPENNDRYWGLISKEDCYKEYEMMIRVQNLGVKTCNFSSINQILGDFNTESNPYNLIYTLENPLRLIDLDFLGEEKKNLVKENLTKDSNYDEVHLTVVEYLSIQLEKLYANGIIHNALSTHNITLSLELIDFETSFDKETFGVKNFEMFIPRELIHLREIGFSLSHWFRENYNIRNVEKIIKAKKFDRFLN